MYMSRYAINEWGMFFLQKVKGFELQEAAFIIAVNTIAGIIGTVCAGWISDTVFKGDRKWPALVAGICESIALVLFLYGGDSWIINVLAMALFGIAIGVLISFVGGLMAIDLVPRKATGAALGIVGMASYAAAGLMNIISGWLIDGQALRDEVTGEILQYDFSYVSIFWVAAATISFLLPILNWGRKKQEI
jgi:OPA family sugar phosphate sensor protein UhpC-like MFS transporter